MIRTIITPDNQTVLFEIPKDYVGKEIEIIAFAKSDYTNNNLKKLVSFNALSLNTTGYKFDRNEANER